MPKHASSMPEHRYVAQVQGWSPTERKGSQRMAKVTSGSAGLNPCSTTLVFLRTGLLPAVTMQMGTLKQWIELLCGAEEALRQEIGEAWISTHRKLDTESARECGCKYSDQWGIPSLP